MKKINTATMQEVMNALKAMGFEVEDNEITVVLSWKDTDTAHRIRVYLGRNMRTAWYGMRSTKVWSQTVCDWQIFEGWGWYTDSHCVAEGNIRDAGDIEDLVKVLLLG